MNRPNNIIRMPGQAEVAAMQMQHQAAQTAFLIENAKTIATVAASVLGRPGAETPQQAVELACEILFRSLSTLSLPRMQEMETTIKNRLHAKTD